LCARRVVAVLDRLTIDIEHEPLGPAIHTAIEIFGDETEATCGSGLPAGK